MSAFSLLIILRITSPPNSLLENLKPLLNLNKYENQRETGKSILQTNGFCKWIFITMGQAPVSRKHHNKGNYLLAVLCIHRRYFALFAAVKGS